MNIRPKFTYAFDIKFFCELLGIHKKPVRRVLDSFSGGTTISYTCLRCGITILTKRGRLIQQNLK